MELDKERKIKLKEYFSCLPSVAMVFVFGSFAGGRQRAESDLDVAIYFYPKNKKEVEWEEEKKYPDEEKIWLEVEKIVGREVDLMVLNRAPARLSFAVLRAGQPLIIKDKTLYFKFWLRVSAEAIDFITTANEYWAIKARSRSLSEIDQQSLKKIGEFLAEELSDWPFFENLSWEEYEGDRRRRREVERWIENIVNCSLDMAKILLASEKKRLPETYKEILKSLSLLPGFDREVAFGLAADARLRNILAHEYLDLRFQRLEEFIKKSRPRYEYLLNFVANFLR